MGFPLQSQGCYCTCKEMEQEMGLVLLCHPAVCSVMMSLVWCCVVAPCSKCGYCTLMCAAASEQMAHSVLCFRPLHFSYFSGGKTHCLHEDMQMDVCVLC